MNQHNAKTVGVHFDLTNSDTLTVEQNTQIKDAWWGKHQSIQ